MGVKDYDETIRINKDVTISVPSTRMELIKDLVEWDEEAEEFKMDELNFPEFYSRIMK